MAGRHGLEIRAAVGADAAGIAALWEAAGQAVPVPGLGARLEALRREPGAALLALEWGPPSGLVVVAWHRTLADDLPVAQITTLLVGPEERRRGIGRTLLKAAAQAARLAGCGTLQLTVPNEGPSLRAFCEATGFAATGSAFVRPLRKRA